jgi:hypothetical protein
MFIIRYLRPDGRCVMSADITSDPLREKELAAQEIAGALETLMKLPAGSAIKIHYEERGKREEHATA